MSHLVQHDNTKEEVLDQFLFKLDENPILKINPIEETSYLGIPFAISVDHYYGRIQDEVKKYKEYIKDFVQKNSESPEAYKYVESTLNWLLIKLNKVRTKFVESPLRKEWHVMSHGYVIPNPNKLARIINDEKNTRQAYRFFYQMSKIQLLFIEDLISFISGQVLPITKINRDLDHTDNPLQLTKSKEVYYFTIKEQHSKFSHHFILRLHSELKKNGFINCTLPDLKKLFIKYSDERPCSSPKPIIWTGKYYNSLAYLIRQLSGTFITRTKAPSNYEIAINLFHNNTEGSLFTPSKYRYDYNLNRKVKKTIDNILKESWQNLDDNTIK